MTAKLFNLLDIVTREVSSDCFHFVYVDSYTDYNHLPHGRYFVLDSVPSVTTLLAPLFSRKLIPSHYISCLYRDGMSDTSFWFKL